MVMASARVHSAWAISIDILKVSIMNSCVYIWQTLLSPDPTVYIELFTILAIKNLPSLCIFHVYTVPVVSG